MSNNTGIKLWLIVVAALVAIVVVGAGGLRPARAENDKKPGWQVSDSVATRVCMRSGTPDAICIMKYAVTEAVALNLAEDVLEKCASVSEPPSTATVQEFKAVTVCRMERAYIRQRWGVQ
jgi:hypothetical protein